MWSSLANSTVMMKWTPARVQVYIFASMFMCRHNSVLLCICVPNHLNPYKARWPIRRASCQAASIMLFRAKAHRFPLCLLPLNFKVGVLQNICFAKQLLVFDPRPLHSSTVSLPSKIQTGLCLFMILNDYRPGEETLFWDFVPFASVEIKSQELLSWIHLAFMPTVRAQNIFQHLCDCGLVVWPMLRRNVWDKVPWIGFWWKSRFKKYT